MPPDKALPISSEAVPNHAINFDDLSPDLQTKILGSGILQSLAYSNQDRMTVSELQAAPKVLAKWQFDAVDAGNVGDNIAIVFAQFIGLTELGNGTGDLIHAEFQESTDDVSYNTMLTLSDRESVVFSTSIGRLATDLFNAANNSDNPRLFIRFVLYTDANPQDVAHVSANALLFPNLNVTITRII